MTELGSCLENWGCAQGLNCGGLNMLFVVLFTDRTDQAALRAKYLQAHIDWVAAHQAQVRVAGSLREQLGQVPKGGL